MSTGAAMPGEWHLNKRLLCLISGPEGRWTVAPGESPEMVQVPASPGGASEH